MLEDGLFPLLDALTATLKPEQQREALATLHAYEIGTRHQNSIVKNLGVPQEIMQDIESGIPEMYDGGRDFYLRSEPVLQLLQKHRGEFNQAQLQSILKNLILNWQNKEQCGYSRDVALCYRDALIEVQQQGASPEQLLTDLNAGQYPEFDLWHGRNADFADILTLGAAQALEFERKDRTLATITSALEWARIEDQWATSMGMMEFFG